MDGDERSTEATDLEEARRRVLGALSTTASQRIACSSLSNESVLVTIFAPFGRLYSNSRLVGVKSHSGSEVLTCFRCSGGGWSHCHEA